METGQAGTDQTNLGPIHLFRQGEAWVVLASVQLQIKVQRLQDQGEASEHPDQHPGSETGISGDK